MPSHLQAIANEFDSYMQDRAQRLGYRVRALCGQSAQAPPASGRYALVEFSDGLPQPGRDAFAAPGAMRAHHDRGHFVAWSGAPGALVQVNIQRHELYRGGNGGGDGGGDGGRMGVRTFAEEFFGNPQGRSLSRDALRAYLDWLVAATPAANATSAAMQTLAIQAPDARELLLVRLPSAAAARDWLWRAP